MVKQRSPKPHDESSNLSVPALIEPIKPLNDAQTDWTSLRKVPRNLPLFIDISYLINAIDPRKVVLQRGFQYGAGIIPFKIGAIDMGIAKIFEYLDDSLLKHVLCKRHIPSSPIIGILQTYYSRMKPTLSPLLF